MENPTTSQSWKLVRHYYDDNFCKLAAMRHVWPDSTANDQTLSNKGTIAFNTDQVKKVIILVHREIVESQKKGFILGLEDYEKLRMDILKRAKSMGHVAVETKVVSDMESSYWKRVEARNNAESSEDDETGFDVKLDESDQDVYSDDDDSD